MSVCVIVRVHERDQSARLHSPEMIMSAKRDAYFQHVLYLKEHFYMLLATM